MFALLLVLGIVLLVLSCIAFRQPRVVDRVAYWQAMMPDLDETADRLYAQIYQALRDGLERRGVSLSGLDFGPQYLFETHSVFSQRPRYLCARYRHLTYYLYLSPTPAGLFASSSLFSKYVRGEGEGRIFSAGARRYFLRQTMFQFDAAVMFQEAVHSIVLNVLDRATEAEQLKPLEAYERRPIYHAFYRAALPPVPSPLLDPALFLPPAALSKGTVSKGTFVPAAARPGDVPSRAARGDALAENAPAGENGSAFGEWSNDERIKAKIGVGRRSEARAKTPEAVEDSPMAASEPVSGIAT